MYIKRTVESTILTAFRDFPVTLVIGPRQSGKTTTLIHLLGSNYQYISLDTPDMYAAVSNDPRVFPSSCEQKVILDEV